MSGWLRCVGAAGWEGGPAAGRAPGAGPLTCLGCSGAESAVATAYKQREGEAALSARALRPGTEKKKEENAGSSKCAWWVQAPRWRSPPSCPCCSSLGCRCTAVSWPPPSGSPSRAACLVRVSSCSRSLPSIIWRILSLAKDSKQRSSLRVT
nr:keratinocyte-associated protein 2 isoform X2 [Gorilla gorilla gorilla]